MGRSRGDMNRRVRRCCGEERVELMQGEKRGWIRLVGLMQIVIISP